MGGIRGRSLRRNSRRMNVIDSAIRTRRMFTVALIRRKILTEKKLIFSKVLKFSVRS